MALTPLTWLLVCVVGATFMALVLAVIFGCIDNDDDWE